VKKEDYKVDHRFIKKLDDHIKKLHARLKNGRHSLHADRRLQKYTALRKIKRLYENKQLTEEHIQDFEHEFGKMYKGLLSHTTRDLVSEAKERISSNPTNLEVKLPPQK